MELAVPRITTSREVEQVLVDTLVVAHHRYATVVGRVCGAAVDRRRKLSAADVGDLLVARAELELAAAAATFDLRDHWVLAGGEHDCLGDLKRAVEAAVDGLLDREEVLDLLRSCLARNRVRAQKLLADPCRLDCDLFFAEVILERRAVEAVAEDVLEAALDLYVAVAGLTEKPCWC